VVLYCLIVAIRLTANKFPLGLNFTPTIGGDPENRGDPSDGGICIALEIRVTTGCSSPDLGRQHSRA